MNNERAEHMWKIISHNYDFSQAVSAIDLGCCYGDMLVNLHEAGVRYIHGYENDMDVYRIANNKVKGFPGVRLHLIDVEENGWFWPKADIIFCFSVLPYLRRISEFLENVKDAAQCTFIECQYAGDGPGLEHIKNDDDMFWFLNDYWGYTKPIGKTHIEGRDKWRTIWMCR